jgi:hypothetical protein
MCIAHGDGRYWIDLRSIRNLRILDSAAGGEVTRPQWRSRAAPPPAGRRSRRR